MLPRSPDAAACRATLAGGSRSFHAAAWILPRAYRDSATALYAYCRAADDAIDLDPRGDAVEVLRERLDLIYAGRPADDAADRAFAAAVERHAIPRALPDALLEGFAWDRAGRRYDDLPALEDYAARVAGTVGAMMALIMDTRAPEALARACDLGVAMQLTNIARDVGEDARAGRVYLPLAWLREAGIDADRFVAEPRFDHALAGVVRRLLQAADAHYARAASAVAALPPACRPAIHAARLLYAAIGDEVLRNGGDSVTRRAVVAPRRKAALVSQALAASLWRTALDGAAPLPATRHLVHAAAAVAAPEPRSTAAFVLDLFERLERRDRLQRMTS